MGLLGSKWRGGSADGRALLGKEAFRMIPLAAAPLGSGGGDTRPPPREGRRPGCDEERVLLCGGLLGLGTEPADVVESAGEAERVLGPDILVVRR